MFVISMADTAKSFQYGLEEWLQKLQFADCTGTDWDYKGKTLWP
jgi:hypothetical protein